MLSVLPSLKLPTNTNQDKFIRNLQRLRFTHGECDLINGRADKGARALSQCGGCSVKGTQDGTGGKGIRTPGLLIANETLYQLSYTPVYL
jgi:hypothetical protein